MFTQTVVSEIRLMQSYLYVSAALVLTVYAQVLIKYRAIVNATPDPAESSRLFLISMFTDPWVISAFLAAVAAAAAWMLAIRKEDLSVLYPLMALTFVLVPIFAALLLGERIAALQFIGMVMIVGGVSLAALAR